MDKDTVIITKEDTKIQEAIDALFERDLILYNDDVNTFDHVVDCLQAFCNHTSIQAEQCAHIVHHNGKTGVKRGRMEVLIPIMEALTENKLSCKIE